MYLDNGCNDDVYPSSILQCKKYQRQILSFDSSCLSILVDHNFCNGTQQKYLRGQNHKLSDCKHCVDSS